MPDILTVKSPFDGHFIRDFELSGEKEIERAINIAHNLFLDQSRWLP